MRGYVRREEADKAVEACHNKKTLPGASCPLQVKYADGELERLEHKVFIGMLPKNVSEGEVTSLFSKYGTLKDLQVLRGSQQTSKGCAFVKYETKEQAVAAIEDLNGKHKMEGSTVPLVVKWADTEKERLARKTQKAQSLASNFAGGDPAQNPSLFGALPMGYISPYNGYGYQLGITLRISLIIGVLGMVMNSNTTISWAAGSYGLMPYRLAPGQNPNSLPRTPRNYAVPPNGYLGSPYPVVPGAQYSVAYPGGMINNRPLSGPPSPVPPAVANNLATSSSIGSSPGDQIEGPPGANLFIYHIPQEFGDEELANAFQRFGRVVSAKVFVDKATGVSKCFGFVSYDSSAAAESAINTMNGYQLGGKKLKEVIDHTAYSISHRSLAIFQAVLAAMQWRLQPAFKSPPKLPELYKALFSQERTKFGDIASSMTFSLFCNFRVCFTHLLLQSAKL
ncbi:RNA-binding protein-defense related 1 [Artemisia annua]|uniref:RNA-binding protein-defense related 1 n=1 Tax=Artemisia annua TaxID=35608 RepID=A0A2U1N175_ARTAN|nr:RNA-binding protein-defense related 1 [Artemisia annua]